MKYPFLCENNTHEVHYFEVDAPIQDGPKEPQCPQCHERGFVRRLYTMEHVIYNAPGFSRDYFSKNPGRGQSWDKKENLNTNWSKHFGEPPPKEDSRGTYDGT